MSTIVWNYGGGTQSQAIAVLILQGKLPKPDIAIIADTGREKQETWDYMEEVTRPALASIGLGIQVAPHELATVDLFSHTGKLLIPAWTTKNGKVGQLSTYCSSEWKKYVVRRWLREQGVEQCEQWLGISIDELERMKDSDVKWATHVYPLIELVPMNRAQCHYLVTSYGWPEPPRSACYMCPFLGTREWQHMKKEYPQDFTKAIELEASIRVNDKHVWLHRDGKLLDKAIEASEMQGDMFDACDSGFCYT